MNVALRFTFAGLCCCFALLMSTVYAEPPQLPENYRALKLYELDRTVKALTPNGFTSSNRADAFVAWMAENDWRSLDINSLLHLYEWVSADSLDPHHFSARWTGFLTAPATGAYTFRQVRAYKGADCRINVTISGQSVLDSKDSSKDASFLSGPVQLTAGQAVPIQIDLVHKAEDVVPIVDFSESAPMALLSWKSGQGAEAIIPSSAFTPPQGIGEAGTHGLKGQYFGKMDLSDLKLTRMDPALDMVWSWPPVAPFHQEESSAVLAACKAKLLDAQFLVSCAKNRPLVLSYDMWRLAYRMTATDRRQLVQTLRNQPDVLRALPTAVMGRMMQGIYMLPGEEHIQLLGEWALATPQPRCTPGKFPGYGEGTYQALNTDFYWLIGRFIQGPYGKQLDTLCDRYLARPDGECNLAVAYAAAYASWFNGTRKRFSNRLDERINDKTLAGDKLMTWLLARAYAKGAVPGNPLPMANFSDLESAYTVAESNDHKFWALQEMVARLSSVNKGDRAKTLLEQHRSEFTTQAQQQAMTGWIAKADALATTYSEHQAAQKKTVNANYKKELERRRQAAVARGDNAAASRFAGLIGATESAPQQ